MGVSFSKITSSNSGIFENREQVVLENNLSFSINNPSLQAYVESFTFGVKIVVS